MKFPFKLHPANVFDAVGFGTNAVDHLIGVPEYPAFNSKIELTDYVQSAGGEIASTMVGLQRLGLKTAYAGRFGDDPAGMLGLTSLIDEGVDLAHAETIAGARTQGAFIVIDERSGERTVIWHRDAKLAYTKMVAPTAAASLGRVLHMTPHDTAACIAMAQAARFEGVIVSLDIDNVFDGVEMLLSFVDVCVMSDDLPRKLLGGVDNRGALREINSRFGCAVVGLTLGAQGSLFLCGGSFIETTGLPVPGGCVDTTGAGDAFRCGFLYGMLTGESVEASARIGNAVAALKCRSFGARSGLPTLRELDATLKES